MATKKLILDLDMGVDDAMALAYAVASPEVELVRHKPRVLATCRVDQSAHNCLAVLDLLGRPEVPAVSWVPSRPDLRRPSPIRRRRQPRSSTARTASAVRACPRRPMSRWGQRRPTATLRSII